MDSDIRRADPVKRAILEARIGQGVAEFVNNAQELVKAVASGIPWAFNNEVGVVALRSTGCEFRPDSRADIWICKPGKFDQVPGFIKWFSSPTDNQLARCSLRDSIANDLAFRFANTLTLWTKRPVTQLGLPIHDEIQVLFRDSKVFTIEAAKIYCGLDPVDIVPEPKVEQQITRGGRCHKCSSDDGTARTRANGYKLCFGCNRGG